jgi:hypothetical protein
MRWLTSLQSSGRGRLMVAVTLLAAVDYRGLPAAAQRGKRWGAIARLCGRDARAARPAVRRPDGADRRQQAHSGVFQSTAGSDGRGPAGGAVRRPHARWRAPLSDEQRPAATVRADGRVRSVFAYAGRRPDSDNQIGSRRSPPERNGPRDPRTRPRMRRAAPDRELALGTAVRFGRLRSGRLRPLTRERSAPHVES